MKPANVLVLDEPTNDLDLETLELLEELIGNFDGTVLLVSHDREFLDDVTTSLIVFEGAGKLREFIGDYDAWRRTRPAETARGNAPAKTEKPKASAAVPAAAPANPPQKKKLSYKETRELEAIPQKIDALEAEQKALAEKLNDPDFCRDPAAAKAAAARLDAIEEELMLTLERWEALEARK